VESDPDELEQLSGLLDDVESAMRRLDDGSYGSCQSCGVLIDDSVLAQQPALRQCGSCSPPSSDS